jgi:hypothetical protein
VTTQPPISSPRRTDPRADPDLAETLVYTGKVAQLIWLSWEQFTQPNTSGMLSNRAPGPSASGPTWHT